ncbi:MAG: hypothetical protein C0594_09585, partial [Marinilabiliales bacterium]
MDAALDGQTISTCSGDFYDSGGPSNNYSLNENYVVTFCSDDGTHFHVDFTFFESESTYDGMNIYDGTSTSATLIGAIDGSLIGTFSYTSTDDCLTFEWISDNLFADYGGFEASFSCAIDNPPTNGDCGNAIPVCQDTYTQTQSVTGVGTVNEIALAETAGVDDCFSTVGEHNSTWYIFTVNQTGTFEFAIQTTVDYDWGLYDVSNNSCQDIMDGTIAMESCNWSGAVGDSTGISGDLAGELQFEDAITVNAGNTYVLVVDNFTGGATGYTLNLNNGTAGIYDNDPPVLQTITSAPACGDNTITVQFSENVACSSVSATDFSLQHESGDVYTITNVSSTACSGGAANSDTYTLTLSENMIAGGTYTLSLIDQVEDACNNTISTNSLSFTVSGVVAAVNYTYPTCYNGNDATITASASGGTSPYSFNWSTGSSSPSLSGLSVGTYVVTVTDAGGVCEDIRTIDITNTQILMFEDFDPNVSGWTHAAISGTDTWATGDPNGGNGSSSIGSDDPTVDHTATNTNNNVYGQGLGSGSGTDCSGGAYCNSTNEYLMSPSIDCSGKTNVHLQFYRWANFETSFDEAYVEVSTDGSSWNSLGHPQYPQDNAWILVDLDASAYADNQSTVYFRWRMESDGSVTYSGWNIDDVTVTADLVELVASFSNINDVDCYGDASGSTDVTITGGTP